MCSQVTHSVPKTLGQSVTATQVATACTVRVAALQHGTPARNSQDWLGPLERRNGGPAQEAQNQLNPCERQHGSQAQGGHNRLGPYGRVEGG